jgi:hypothetical protein
MTSIVASATLHAPIPVALHHILLIKADPSRIRTSSPASEIRYFMKAGNMNNVGLHLLCGRPA